ncbi:ribosomal protein S18-alanine N-acetyltransferase [Plastorhodobacter daqingensis]|uniref:[Ribosomal protein bS18]-alanine N-acetyltransferase n=1 Tax=Plastorhodobacter daqingensis TaxID=1387281 RepID=A0ABW2UIP7_9RHOB
MTPDALAGLHARCFTLPRPWSRTEFADLLTSPHVFLLSKNEGFALGRAIAGEAELLTIAVAPEKRRTGLGRSLLQQFEAAALARGAEALFLEVACDNLAALQLYATAGFAQTGRRRGYYRTPEGVCTDAIVMGKSLKPASFEAT